VETLEQTTYDVPGAEKGANGLLILHRILPGWDDGPVAVMRSRIYAPLVQQFVQASRWGFFWGAILASAIVAGLCLTLLRWTVRPLYDLSMSLDHEETRFLQRYKKQDNEYGHIARLIERFFEQKRSLITEVYERGKAEEALRTERDQAQLYLDTAGVLMTVIDGHGHIQLVNRQGCRILGYEPGELVGRNVFDACLPPGEGEEARTEFENILRSGDISSRSFEAVVITKTGERRTLSFQSALLPAGGGKGRLLVSGEDVTEQLAAQESLEFMQYAIDKAAEAVYWILPDAAFYYVNESACKCLGYTRDELLGMRVMDIDPEMDDECWAQHWQEVYQRRSFTIESAHKTKSGETFPVEVTVNFIELNDKQFNIAFVRDITGRKAAEAEKERLEEHVRQVQKIESIGWLAGGVAHDFNNLLSPIIGYSDLILERTEQGDPLRDEMSQIKMAAERGAILTRQLLAFGRRQMLDMKNQQLNEVVLAFEKMLCRIIGEDIELVFNPQPGLWDIRADAGQLEQVLMNLAANARDAMPGGGKISIATSNEIMDEERIEGRPMKPGSYVTLTFSDTGYGIDEAHLGRIFEPFFTTKPADKGSGLGLAMVYGIIKQHGAFIWVSSQPGEGSVFRIHFPAVFDTPVELAAPVPTVVKKVGGEETILVVEDEEPVRNLVVEILRINGYNVLSASNPVEAITLSEEYAGQIDLLLSDVIMPQMNGKELYHRLAFCRPDIKILYMSGYTGDTVLSYGIMDVGLQFLQKPFTLQALTQKVRQVLDSA
jgi:PAS domain S-box-containing protein